MAMSTLAVGVRITAGLGLILANAFFVAIEFALTRARQYSRAEFDEPGLHRAWEMTQDLEIYLTSCQVGITASSIAVGIVAEPALAALFEPVFANTALASASAGAILAFLVINLVHLTHGEQTPTYLGVERAKFVCRYGATPLYWFNKLISPVIRLGDWVAKGTLGLFGIEMTGAWLETEVDTIESRGDLRNRLGSLLERGELPDERKEEVLNALRIGQTAVREIMVDPGDVVALSTAVDPEENLRRMAEEPHTRYPLVGEELSDFHGIVYSPLLARYRDAVADGDLDVRDLATDTMTLSPDTDVSDAIDQFQVESQELALVVEDGAVIGLVTITDALEEVMGQSTDPIDEELGIA